MAQRKDGHRGTDAEDADGSTDYDATLGRRRLLKLTGAGLLAAVAGVGTASAQNSSTNGAGQLPLGGGTGYANTVARGDADVVVETLSDLEEALDGAADGDVVYVAGGATIDVESEGVEVPAGVTLASNRGIDGSHGALIRTDDESIVCVSLNGDARVTGLRMKGPRPGGDTEAEDNGDGVKTFGDGEVDNCVIWGFTHAGVSVEGGDEARVHHNVICECNRDGYGYGVVASAGHPIIEYNYFNWNRHSIASSGGHHGYTARFNHFGPDLTDTPIDVHEPGCVRVEIHNNVVEGVRPNKGRFEGEQHQSVQVRGTPDEVATIHDNWFYNPNPPGDSPEGWGDDSAIIQPLNDEWENVEWDNNHYGPDAGVGFGDVIPSYSGEQPY